MEIPFFMSNKIIINIQKSVIIIHNKYHVNFSSLERSKSSIICSAINRVLFPGDIIQVPAPQDFLNHEFVVELLLNSKKTGHNHQLSKMTIQLLHYLIVPNFLYPLKEIINSKLNNNSN